MPGHSEEEDEKEEEEEEEEGEKMGCTRSFPWQPTPFPLTDSALT